MIDYDSFWRAKSIVVIGQMTPFCGAYVYQCRMGNVNVGGASLGLLVVSSYHFHFSVTLGDQGRKSQKYESEAER